MIISWLEEPGFMLVMISLIGLSYQENMLKAGKPLQKKVKRKKGVKSLYTVTGAAK